MSLPVEQRPGRLRPGFALRAAGWLVALGAVAYGAVLARASLFGILRATDDEGYMLLALRAWREGGGLYDRIVTPYGPFYFGVVTAVLTVLRLPFDNSGARELVLGEWVTTALLLAVLAWRLRRSRLAVVAVWVLCFPMLRVLRNEPLHPGGLLAVLLPVLALASLGLRSEGGGVRTWALLGALAAATALSKLNAGLLVVLAVVGTWLRFASGAWLLRVSRTLFAALLVALPFVLTRGHLEELWVRSFATVVSLSLLPFALTTCVPPDGGSWRPGKLLAFLGGGAAIAGVAFGVCFLSGTTLAGAWSSLVLGTLQFPDAFMAGKPVQPVGEVLALLLLVPAAYLLRAVRSPWSSVALSAIKVGAALFAIHACVARASPLEALPCLWVFAFPGSERRDEAGTKAPLVLLALLVALRSLLAFPVMGSQVGLVAFPVPFLAVLAIVDAWRELPERWRTRMPRAATLAGTAVVVVAGAWGIVRYHRPWRTLLADHRQYDTRGVELGLPGTEGIRVTEWQATTLPWLVANLRRHGETFLSVPGRHSLYLWTELRPPVPFFSSWWPVFYDEAEQRELFDRLLASPAPCVVTSPAMLASWERQLLMSEPPLMGWLDERLRLAGTVGPGDFALWIPRETAPDLVLSAVVVRDASDESAGSRVLRLALPERRGEVLERIALARAGSAEVLCDSAAAAPVIHMTLRGEDGRIWLGADGPPRPVTLDRPRVLSATCPGASTSAPDARLLVRGYDASGRVVLRLPVVR